MKKLILFLAAMTGIAVCGCSGDEPQYPTPLQVTEIVTVDANDGSRMLLSTDKGRVISCVSQTSKVFFPGRRVLIAYAMNIADTSLSPVPAVLQGYRAIQFDTVRALPLDRIDKLPKPRVNILSSWRAGDFINFQFGLEYDGRWRDCAVVADASTISDDEVRCVFVSSFTVNADSAVSRRDFGSYYTGALGLRPGQRLVIEP